MIFQDPKFSQKWTNFEQNKHLENRLYRPNVYKTVIYGQTRAVTLVFPALFYLMKNRVMVNWAIFYFIA